MEIKAETVEQLAEAMGVEVSALSFEVYGIGSVHLNTLGRKVGSDHDAIIAQGAAWSEQFGPAASQVTIEASVTPFTDGTFAIRHLHHESHYNGESDSGWRIWVANDFRGGLEPDSWAGLSREARASWLAGMSSPNA